MNPLDITFDRAAEDRRRGAVEIECKLIEDLLSERQRWTATGLISGAERLLAGQPAMANLRNLARELVGGDLATAREWLVRRSVLLAELDERFAAAAWPLIEGAERLLTISRSSAVAAVVVGAWRRGWRGETVVFDGSPAGGGIDQAQRLGESLDDVHSQPDSAMSGWLVGNGIRVLIGADAVSPERLVNVSGTSILLELAFTRSIPVVVVADSGKDLPDDEIDELLASGPTAAEGNTGRRWAIFEVVPLNLVSTRICE